MNLREATLGFRHYIVKIVAPKVYNEACRFRNAISIELQKVPRPMTLFVGFQPHYSIDCSCVPIDNCCNGYLYEEDIIGCEIGVGSGDNALNMLQLLPLKKLYLIDPYIKYFDCDTTWANCSNTEKIAKEKLSEFTQCCFIKKMSSDAVQDIKDSLDFVYIDGNHSYKNVREDIMLYYPLVKDGGVLGGHDYLQWMPSVRKAVDEFVEKKSLKLNVCFPDWFVVKN
jgi:hypothetical protein